MLSLRCPRCQRVVKYKIEMAGKRASCPNPECDAVLQIPPAITPAARNADRGAPSPPVSSDPSVSTNPRAITLARQTAGADQEDASKDGLKPNCSRRVIAFSGLCGGGLFAVAAILVLIVILKDGEQPEVVGTTSKEEVMEAGSTGSHEPRPGDRVPETRDQEPLSTATEDVDPDMAGDPTTVDALSDGSLPEDFAFVALTRAGDQLDVAMLAPPLKEVRHEFLNEGQEVALSSGRDAVRGLRGNGLRVQQRNKGNVFDGSFELHLLWTPEPFACYRDGELLGIWDPLLRALRPSHDGEALTSIPIGEQVPSDQLVEEGDSAPMNIQKDVSNKASSPRVPDEEGEPGSEVPLSDLSEAATKETGKTLKREAPLPIDAVRTVHLTIENDFEAARDMHVTIERMLTHTLAAVGVQVVEEDTLADGTVAVSLSGQTYRGDPKVGTRVSVNLSFLGQSSDNSSVFVGSAYGVFPPFQNEHGMPGTPQPAIESEDAIFETALANAIPDLASYIALHWRTRRWRVAVSLANDESYAIRWKVKQLLLSSRKWIDKGLQDPAPEVRMAAIEARRCIEDLSGLDRMAIEDADLEVRKLAAETLTKAGTWSTPQDRDVAADQKSGDGVIAYSKPLIISAPPELAPLINIEQKYLQLGDDFNKSPLFGNPESTLVVEDEAPKRFPAGQLFLRLDSGKVSVDQRDVAAVRETRSKNGNVLSRSSPFAAKDVNAGAIVRYHFGAGGQRTTSIASGMAAGQASDIVDSDHERETSRSFRAKALSKALGKIRHQITRQLHSSLPDRLEVRKERTHLVLDAHLHGIPNATITGTVHWTLPHAGLEPVSQTGLPPTIDETKVEHDENVGWHIQKTWDDLRIIETKDRSGKVTHRSIITPFELNDSEEDSEKNIVSLCVSGSFPGNVNDRLVVRAIRTQTKCRVNISAVRPALKEEGGK